MDLLIECIPNVSEGRRPEVVDAIGAAVEGIAGVTMLDRTSDEDHDRSVFTFVGPVDAVSAAIRAMAAQTIARIDLRSQRGQHPRIGALDVVPFVPLGATSMDVCIELARDLGSWLADRYDMPVFLYAAAARRADRRVLADIRRPGFEGLQASLATRDGGPDFGPRRIHPTAGATVVGARPFLIAWNIQLATEDVDVARRIASRIRERGGGLPAVQALGLPLASQGCVQVSMNLLDHERTPMWQVFERVQELAFAAGIAIRNSELIGLAPLAAFIATADHIGTSTTEPPEGRVLTAARWLAIRGATHEMAIELRLAAVRAPGAQQTAVPLLD